VNQIDETDVLPGRLFLIVPLVEKKVVVSRKRLL